VSIVKEQEKLPEAIDAVFGYGSDVMVQRYISGKEVTCAIVEESNGELLALPPTEIIPKSGEFFDYDAKYSTGASEEITPARFPPEILAKIQQIAITAHKILGCSGMSRTDMIVTESDIYVLETITIPGMTETSLMPQAAHAVGISFSELLNKIISAALKGKE
jgi:D-alanine-D-alanine ligase